MDDATQQPAELKHETSEVVDLSVDPAEVPPVDTADSQANQGMRVVLISLRFLVWDYLSIQGTI